MTGGEPVPGRRADLCFAVAHSMLGDRAAAEGVVREARARWAGDAAAGPPPRLVARLALVRLRAARAGGEPGIGPWLPEPLLAEPGAELAESLSAGMAAVLGTLDPVARTAFLLRRCFGLSPAEIAAATGRPPAAVRRILAGAEARVRGGPRPVEPGELVRRFVTACARRDGAALRAVLADDVVLAEEIVLSGDGAPPRRTVPGAGRAAGPDAVAERLLARCAAGPPRSWSRTLGQDGLVVVWPGAGSVIGAIVLRLGPDAVREIDLVVSGGPG